MNENELNTDQRDGILKIEGGSDGSINGSHHLMIELIKAITDLDREHYIITGFEANIKFVEDQEVDETDYTYLGKDNNGTEVMIDTTALDRLQGFRNVPEIHKRELLQFIDSYANRENDIGWIDYIKLKQFIDKVMYLLCRIYGKRLIAALLDQEPSRMFNGDTVEWHDVNDLFKVCEIRYHIRHAGDKYIIDRLN